MVSAEIAVVMAVPIENPADCEVRRVIRFLQAAEINSSSIFGFYDALNISGH